MDPVAIIGSGASWLWEKYGQSVAESVKEFATGSWTTARWMQAEATYKNKLLKIYSTTKLLGNSKDISIEEIYIDVFAHSTLSSKLRVDVSDPEYVRRILDRQESWNSRISLLNLLKSSRRLFVLGRPGAGKSTFMRKAVFECCRGSIGRTPVLISLKQWADSDLPIFGYIVKEFETCGFPATQLFVEKLLEAGELLVLLDGLDEIPESTGKRNVAISEITRLTKQYLESSFVITCRTAATDFTLESFVYAEIADLLPEQQVSLIKNWFRTEPELLTGILESWSLPANSGLIDLAKTPLLLALFCLAYEDTLHFPRRLVDLYEEAANSLLRRWDSSRGIVRDQIYKSLSPGRKEQLLARLAFRTFSREEIFIRKKRACTIISQFLGELPPSDYSGLPDAETVLMAIESQHGLVVERANGIYAFSHLTLHEYFTAKYIVENSSEDEMHNLLFTHSTEDQWREIIIMVSSMSDDASPIIESLIFKMRELLRANDEMRGMLESLMSTSEFYGSRDLIQQNFNSNSYHDKLGFKAVQHLSSLELSIRVVGADSLLRLLPSRLVHAINANPQILHEVYGSHPKRMDKVNSFFGLAAMIGDCLATSITSKRRGLLSDLLSAFLPVKEASKG